VSAEASCPALPDFGVVPGLPRDEEGAVFAAPWEAKAFALVVHLHQQGRFAWQEWVDALSGEIAADRERVPHTPYYELWLAAAEKLMAGKGLVEGSALSAARAALRATQVHDHDHPHDHDHDHDHDHHNDVTADHAFVHEHDHAHDHDVEHVHDREA
jgi:nitrile hydratase accessory protein